jgi:hypothetical protein
VNDVLITPLLSWLNLPGLNAILGGLSTLVAFLVISLLPLYFVVFGVFEITRLIAHRRDLLEYNKIAGTDPTVKWEFETSEIESPKVKRAGVS